MAQMTDRGLRIDRQDLSDPDLAPVRRVVEMQERILRLLDDLEADASVDGRWLQIGRTGIEQGFMAVNRSFIGEFRMALPEDAA